MYSFRLEMICDSGLIIDVSFLSFSSEEEAVQIEKDWFRQNPEAGIFIHRPINGTSTNPLSIEPTFHNLLANKNIDGLRELIPTLKQIMHISPYPQEDTVIYIHCTAGKDRTGEVAAAYLMQNKNMSFMEANELNKQIAGREVYPKQANAICLYALYLRNAKNCSWIGPIFDDTYDNNSYNINEG